MRNYEEYRARIEGKVHAATMAVIREAECIGCMKCLHACPVDAIVGAAKQMHTVIAMECTGCELCVEPCPVDCIDMVPLAKPLYDFSKIQKRFEARTQRLSESAKLSKKLAVIKTMAERKDYIAGAVARVKTKRNPLIPTTNA